MSKKRSHLWCSATSQVTCSKLKIQQNILIMSKSHLTSINHSASQSFWRNQIAEGSSPSVLSQSVVIINGAAQENVIPIFTCVLSSRADVYPSVPELFFSLRSNHWWLTRKPNPVPSEAVFITVGWKLCITNLSVFSKPRKQLLQFCMYPVRGWKSFNT